MVGRGTTPEVGIVAINIMAGRFPVHLSPILRLFQQRDCQTPLGLNPRLFHQGPYRRSPAFRTLPSIGSKSVNSMSSPMTGSVIEASTTCWTWLTQGSHRASASSGHPWLGPGMQPAYQN